MRSNASLQSRLRSSRRCPCAAIRARAKVNARPRGYVGCGAKTCSKPATHSRLRNERAVAAGIGRHALVQAVGHAARVAALEVVGALLVRLTDGALLSSVQGAPAVQAAHGCFRA